MNDLIKDFKEFVAGGNLIELAVAFIMGGLIVTVVASLVDNIIMPIIGILFGEPSFDQALILTINDSQIRFGAFFTVVVAVLATALGVYLLVVKPYNRFRKKPPPVEAPPSTELLLTQIRDLLASRR